MQTASLNTVIDAVVDTLLVRQKLGRRLDEDMVERILIDEVGWEKAEELLDRILIEPIIQETIEVDNMDFSEPNDNVGNYWCDRPADYESYKRAVI
ncbi:hypothetical protein [Aneurinibacillus migulanus]|nr:hypothetical protein [Aneurinibacillus migulanus]MED0890939.1 hypothetical protein [Aneurinibacillus migulanus]MED1616631.1 hypothetical protein [Aneurinibacillus migulanus]SDI83070.1 hypothetical protein SAMN04487909_10894 [Aneurinibacillus migulanus]